MNTKDETPDGHTYTSEGINKGDDNITKATRVITSLHEHRIRAQATDQAVTTTIPDNRISTHVRRA